MKITRRQIRRIISEAIRNEPKIGGKYELIKRASTRPGSYSPYRQAQVVGIGRGPLGKTVKVKSLVDRSASLFDIPIQAFRGQFKLIKEALDGSADQQEAAYAVIYTAGYLEASDRGLGRLINQNPKLGEQGDKWIPLDDAFSDIHSVMIGGSSQIKRNNPQLDLSEELDILREGEAAGTADFRESIYKYIEQVEVLVNRQTPMGMSAAEGLRVFGVEGGGVLMGDTAAGDARALIALMDDDNVLSWLDEVETMRSYGELK